MRAGDIKWRVRQGVVDDEYVVSGKLIETNKIISHDFRIAAKELMLRSRIKDAKKVIIMLFEEEGIIDVSN